MQHIADLRSAIISDGSLSSDDAALECYLAVAAVRQRAIEINLDEALTDEYRIAAGKDWPYRRVPIGIVYIRPQSYTMLYSVVSALSSAIAAGNCIAIEVP